MNGLATLLLTCALIGVLGGAAAMAAGALARRVFAADDDLPGMSGAPDDPGVQSAAQGAWRPYGGEPGELILAAAVVCVAGLAALMLLRLLAPWLLAGIGAAAAWWALRTLAPALQRPAARAPYAHTPGGAAGHRTPWVLHGVGDIAAAAVAMGESTGEAGPLMYRPPGGSGTYQFTFDRIGGAWRIYIDAQPPYRGRGAALELTHRLVDGSRYYVCWTGSLDSLPAAIRVAVMWADRTETYIATGQRF